MIDWTLWSDTFLYAAAIMAVVIGICTLRIILGPSAPNRAVALDTLNTVVVSSMLLLSVALNNIIYADVAIVYAIMAYVGTLYIANNIEEAAA